MEKEDIRINQLNKRMDDLERRLTAATGSNVGLHYIADDSPIADEYTTKLEEELKESQMINGEMVEAFKTIVETAIEFANFTKEELTDITGEE